MSEDADEASKTGIRFQRYSHWPAAWHLIVMQALKEAARLGIEFLYVKEKLGGLRIQGGGARLSKIVAKATEQAGRTCIACGWRCEKRMAPDPPLCSRCLATGREKEIEWVEPATDDSPR